MVRPSLHHDSTLGQIGGVVVRRRHGVPLLMRELQLDVRVWEAHLVKKSRRDATKSVSGHAVLVAEPLERLEDRVVRHRPFMIPLAGKHVS